MNHKQKQFFKALSKLCNKYSAHIGVEDGLVTVTFEPGSDAIYLTTSYTQFHKKLPEISLYVEKPLQFTLIK